MFCLKNRSAYSVLIFILVLLISVPVLAETDKEIGNLLRFIEDSGCIFIRNNKEYNSVEAREHLEKKYNYLKGRIKTAESFIKHVATKSSMSGRLYKVRCNGGEISTGEWLNDELQKFRRNSNDGLGKSRKTPSPLMGEGLGEGESD